MASFSTAVIVSILFFCISDASASVIPSENTVEFENSDEIKVHIVERGTKYVEKISIDEKNDLELFHVPAHNGLTEADYLYDFKKNISMRRDNGKATCYLGPLPNDLPKPADLRTGLQRVSETSSKRKVIVQKYWAVSEEVDKALLREAVQVFCGQFPVFRLQEVDLNMLSSAAAGFRDNGRTRFARMIELSNVPFCRKQMASRLRRCHPENWLYNYLIRQRHSTWWVRDCKYNPQTFSMMCEGIEHMFNSIICFTIRCP